MSQPNELLPGLKELILAADISRPHPLVRAHTRGRERGENGAVIGVKFVVTLGMDNGGVGLDNKPSTLTTDGELRLALEERFPILLPLERNLAHTLPVEFLRLGKPKGCIELGELCG